MYGVQSTGTWNTLLFFFFCVRVNSFLLRLRTINVWAKMEKSKQQARYRHLFTRLNVMTPATIVILSFLIFLSREKAIFLRTYLPVFGTRTVCPRTRVSIYYFYYSRFVSVTGCGVGSGPDIVVADFCRSRSGQLR